VTAPHIERVEIGCDTCGAQLTLEQTERSVTCPYCASHAIIERPASQTPRPLFALGFKVNGADAAKRVARWIRSRGLFARSDFKRARVAETRGVYAPAYLYGAVADSSFSAEIGEEYTVVVKRGKTTTTETRTEWCDLHGQHSCYLTDIIVSASRGIENDALEAIEPYNVGELRRYTPELITGWAAEEPSRGQDECFQLAHGEATTLAGRVLSAHMPGDKHRALNHHTHLRDESIDLVLLPVWSFAARYHPEKEPVQILVNGQTGKVNGKVPLSVVKIVTAVVLGLAAIAGGIALLHHFTANAP
jgi:DNA-directed RNA polymerase subunit RPC12/RpoP